MRRYLITLSAFGLLFGASFALFLAQADGYTDAYYVRFTTPRAQSLILGTSKAAQGLQPAKMDPILGTRPSNFSFTIHHSSYGPVYLESIKRKLADDATNGTFIVTVDPWVITSNGEDPDSVEQFPEINYCLGNTTTVDRKPNFGYLWNNLRGNFRKILMPDRRTFLHDDGWLEVKIDMTPETVATRTKGKAEEYRRRHLQQYHFSNTRLKYLEETVSYLSTKGSVYLVRLPVDPLMSQVENEAMPDFDEKIGEARRKSLGYLDLNLRNSEFAYTDGVHLQPESGARVSEIIARWIADSRMARHERSEVQPR